LLFAFGIFFLNPPALAQACAPTVYLFRHAEDGTGGLTNPGKEHAKLYPDMLLQYQSFYLDCPVKRVLATYDGKYPDGRQGTNNPRETAKRLPRAGRDRFPTAHTQNSALRSDAQAGPPRTGQGIPEPGAVHASRAAALTSQRVLGAWEKTALRCRSRATSPDYLKNSLIPLDVISRV
jgi:hypothetical protein